MDQKSLMLDVSEKLAELSKSFRALADSVQDDAKVVESHTEKAKEKKQPEITLEQVRGVLADKSRLGHNAEVRAIIKKYGANRLSEVDPKQYASIIQEVEAL